jgi:hypothetical protein
MSVEENGHRNGEIEEVSSHDDSTAEHSFDDLTRNLATGTVPRRKALRMLAASLFGGTLAAIPGVAWATHNPQHQPGGSKGCPTGQVRVNGQCQCPTDPCPVAGQTRNAQCQCECPGGQLVVDGACVQECGGGRVRNPATGQCECPTGEIECGGQCLSATCPGTGGVARDPVTCECLECEPGEVFCGGECRPECGGGQVRNAATCACECPTGEALCGPQGSQQCLSITCPGTGGELRNPTDCSCVECDPGEVFCGGTCRAECSGGQVRNATTCACECPTGEALCGPQGSQRCVSNACGTGSTFNTTTCRCEANACGATNCEGCCGTTSSGDPICRPGTTNANCGTGGGTCGACTTPATCNNGRCCVASGTQISTCPSTGLNQACCSGKCNPSNSQNQRRCIA